MKMIKKFLAGTLCAIMILENAIPTGFHVFASENVQLESAIDEGTENSATGETMPRNEEEETETEEIRTEEIEETESSTNSKEDRVEERKSEEVKETELDTNINKNKTEDENEKGTTNETTVDETDLEESSEILESENVIEQASYGSSDLVKYAVTGGNIYFDSSTGTIESCDREVTEAIIPSIIGGVDVNGIGTYAFYGCNKLISVTVPNSVTVIKNHAFGSCTSLKQIIISENLISIGMYTFQNCSSLNNIVIPCSVTDIGDCAFEGSGLANITIPDSVTNMGECVFRSCDNLSEAIISNKLETIKEYTFNGCSNLKSIIIPNSVTSIGYAAFEDCSSLVKIIIPDSVTNIGNFAFENCSNLKDIAIPNSVTNIGYAAFEDCSSLVKIIIPDSVTNIGDFAFNGCNALTSISMPAQTKVGLGAFRGCSNISYIEITGKGETVGLLGYHGSWEVGLKEENQITVKIGNGVTSIGKYAFSRCIGLKSIIIPNSVSNIGAGAFEYCSSLTTITIPDSVTSMGGGEFYGCSSLTNVTLPKDITSMDGTFSDCSSLTTITIPNNVTNIGDSAFNGCNSLKRIEIPNSVTNIGSSAFNGCNSLKRIEIPNSVTNIGFSAFSGCSDLTDIIMSDSVTSIGAGAFSDCSSLTTIIIPNSVTSIDYGAFRNCTALTDVTIYNNIPSTPSNIFEGCNSISSVRIMGQGPMTNFDDGVDLKYSPFYTIPKEGSQITVKIETGITSIGNNTFVNCSRLKNITIPNSVTSIGSSAFSNCSGLNSITIPNSVTNIGNDAFSNCDCLKSIVIPDSVTSLGTNTFNGCSGLRDISIPVKLLGNSTSFLNCNSITNIKVIGQGEMHNFYDYYKYTPWYIGSEAGNKIKVKIEVGVNSVGNRAFYGCVGLKSIVIPNGIKTIGNYAFSGCTGLTGDIQIPDSVTSIGEGAFEDCNNLSGNFYVPPSVYYIGARALAPAKMICGERGSYAETYAKNNNIVFKTIDELQNTNPDDIKVENGEVKICAIDVKTNKIIPFTTIIVDGTKYKTGFDGILCITTAIGKHFVNVEEINEYFCIDLVKEKELRSGQLTTCRMSKKEVTDYKAEYLLMKLENANEETGLVGAKQVDNGFNNVYSVYGSKRNEIFKNISERNMVGKIVICTMQKDMITEMELLSDCIVPAVSMVPKTPSISYSKGKYSQKEVETKVSICCGIKRPYPSDFLKYVNVAAISLKKVKLDSDNNVFEFKEGKWLESGKATFEQSVNRDISSAEPYEFTVLLCPNKKFVPDKVSCDVGINIETVYARRDDNIERSENTRGSMHLNNLDMQKTESEEEQQEKIEKLRNDIKSNTIVSLAELSSIYDQNQISQMEEFLTLWTADITMAMDKANEPSLDEKIQNKLLKKMGIDPRIQTKVETKTAMVIIEAETKKNGKKSVIYTLELNNFRFGNLKPFGSYGYMTWQIQDAGGIFPSSGVCTVTTKVDMDSFAKQLNDIASDMASSMINREYNSLWGNDANAVASLYVDKTIMKVIDKRYGSFSNMVLKLVTKPVDMHIKSISKCPVDIYVYNNKDVLCGAIVGNKVYSTNNEVSMYVDDQQAKYVTYSENEYYLKFVGTDTGSMNHYIEEYADVDECVRTITYENIPLTDDTIYYEDIPGYLYADNDIYALISEEGEIVDSDRDTYWDNIEPFVFVDGINIEETKAELKVGESKKLIANLTPANATNKGILWESRDESVATVDGEGLVTAVSEGNATIVAISIDGRYESACDVVVGEAEKVKLSVPKSNYETGLILENGTQIILTSEEEASIYYTTDGTDPTKESTLYTAPIIITNDITIKAIAVKDGYQDSEIAIFSYKVKETEKLSMPKSNYETGAILESRTQIILTSEEEASIYYTLDETDPTKESILYTEPIFITNDMTIKAIAVKDGYQDSEIAVFTYKVGKTPETPPSDEDSDGVLPEDIPADGKIPDGLWIAGVKDCTYTGKAIKPEVRVYDSNRLLKAGQDYTISYKNNTKANDASKGSTAPAVVVKGKGNYTGTEKQTFKILALDLNDTSITAEDITVAYNKKVQKKIPVVIYDGKKLANNKDFTVSYPDKGADAYKAAGTYNILLTAKQGGNFTGTRTVQFIITNNTLISAATVKKIANQTYTGKAIEPELEVTMKKEPLVKNLEYTVTYVNNIESGTATAILTGIGKYAGTKKVTFKINGTPLKGAVVSGITDKVYSSTAQEQNITVTLNNKTLKANVDYKIVYSKNVNAGKATVTINGINAYSGNIKKTFRINAYDMKENTGHSLGGLEKEIKSKYMKGGSRPKLELTFAGRKLREGTDYTVSYQSNKTVTTADTKKKPTIIIKGKGNFKGTLKKTFVITGKALNDTESPVTLNVADKGFVNKAGKYISVPVLTDADGKKLAAGKDYESTVVYTLEDGTELTKNSKVNAGVKVKVRVTGKGAYTGELEGVYQITQNDFNKAKISISPQIYTGKAVTLNKDSVTVKIGKETLAFGTDYEIVENSYANNIKKGTASVTIVGKGNYGGTKTVKFKITARKLSWFWRLFG